LPPTPISAANLKVSSFAALPGWDKDEMAEAWPAFQASCDVLIRRADWHKVCTAARSLSATDDAAVRGFFEQHLQPYQVVNNDGTNTGLVTGYYEPLLQGARKQGGPFQIPLHGTPDDMLNIELAGVYPELKGLRLRGRAEGGKVVPYYTREELSRSRSLAGKELIWVDDAIDAFFLQVQGSGRVYLTDTQETIRVAYADQNGHPYKSIGRYLIDKGELALHQASAQGIKAWAAANPSRLQELLNANPSYVFFKLEKMDGPETGPKGALGVPLTPQRSIAVDPQFVPLGVPVYLSSTRPNSTAPLRRLVMAQDTGSAIKNAMRADFFWGFGAAAGEQAGKMKQRGSMWILLPKSGK
jgi:membrane-bound lytic murein transglycosylase A